MKGTLFLGYSNQGGYVGLSSRCRVTENNIYIYIYRMLIRKLESLAGRLVILKIKVEVNEDGDYEDYCLSGRDAV